MQDERTDALAKAIQSLATVDDPLAPFMLEGVRRRLNLSQGPRRIDRFILGEPLGAGGMGMVHAADDPRLERRVAIKLLRTPGAEGARRGLQEARALARLSHPNVVAVYEAGLHDGQVFVVMELVEGQSLRQWLHTPRSWREVCEVMLAAGRGLAAAHVVDIVHRDFKPDNVLVGERVKVADFGLAHAIDHDTQRSEPRTADSDGASTGRHGIAGTPDFMAPEQLRGEAVDPRTDQFAFCVTFVLALTGRAPFAGSTPLARLVALEHGLPPTAPSGIPRWLWAVLTKGLHPSPEHRYPRLDALLDALERRLRPRRWIGPTAATLAVAGAAATTWWSARTREHSCHEVRQAIEDVWSPARRHALTRAFEATGKPYAAHASTFVSDSLDRYTTEWADARVDACRAEQAGRASTQQVDCLERRRGELLALLDLFEAADSSVVQRASQVISAIPPPSSCSHPDALDDTSTMSEPVRAELEHLRSEVIRAWALWQVGRYASGRDTIEPLIPKLRGLEHSPPLAEALLQQGRLQIRLGELDAAHRSLWEALRLGLSVRADRIVAWAAVALCDELTTQGDFVRAHEYAELAVTMHERLTGERTWPMLVNLEGALLVREHRDADAVEVLAEGLSACNEDDPATLFDAMSMYGNQAAALLRLGRLDEAQAASERSQAIARRLIGEQHPMYAISLIGTAAILDARGDTEGALRVQREALATFQRAVPDPTPATASMIYNTGLFMLTLERHDEALVALREALALWERLLPPGHSRLAQAHAAIGRGLRGQGAYSEAMTHHQRALELLARELQRDEPMAGEMLQQAARTALASGQRELADAWIEHSLRICEKAPNPVLEGELHFLRARSLAMQGEPQRARAEALRALELLRGAQEHATREVEAWLADQAQPPEP